MEKLINKKALFVECKAPIREPDYETADGSVYWEEEDFLYRESKNWSEYHSYKKPVFTQYMGKEVGLNQLNLWLKNPIKLSEDGKNHSLKIFNQLMKGNYTIEEFESELQKLNNELYLNNKPLCGKAKWGHIIDL